MNNLKALIEGKNLNPYQKKLAVKEFEKLLASNGDQSQSLSMSVVGYMFYCQRGDVTGSKRCEKQCEVCNPDY